MSMDDKTASLLDRDFNYHKPDEAKAKKHEFVRTALKDTCRQLLEHIPPCREASIVKTKLEEAMFWANAALARP